MRYLVLLLTFAVFVFANDYKRVLFISSYDMSFPTIKKQIEGIKEVLDEKSYQLDIEFMDTKRLEAAEVELTFFQLLNIKRDVLIKYDAILVGDDNALHFIKNYQNAFFHKKPIVFFAVNDVSFAHLMSKNSYITGVIEKQSIRETFDLINKLHNNSKIVTIIDNTTTAKGVVNSFDKEILNKIEILNVSDYSFPDFEKKLKTIPSNQPLLYISALVDKFSEKKDFYRAIEFINNSTNSPIYHFYEHGIGEGLTGGKVVLFKDQGRKAALIVENVLNGESIDSIKPTDTQNKYLFDYDKLKKFNLLNKIPENSTLINKPKSFLEQPLVDILSKIVILFSVILLAVVFLLYKLYKSSKVLKEKTVEQSGLLSLFDSGDTVLFKWNNDENWTISHVSKNVENLLGYTKEEFINKEVVYSSCIHKDDFKKVLEEVKNNKELSHYRHSPYRLVTKNKKIKWVIDYTVIIKNKNNETTHYLGYLLDITKEKKIQNTLEKLIDSQSSIICLSNGRDLTFANKKFYSFFKCKTIKEFQDRYNSLESLFIENDRFFHLGKIDTDEVWIEKIVEYSENEKIVALSDSSLNIHAFRLNLNKFDEDTYLISLTDISETVIEQIKLEEKTVHDKLTGAYNREFFENQYRTMIKESKESNKELGIALVDIDFFKKINDNYGHDVGDSVLKELVKTINKVSREDDILIRWGGEEFILVLKVNSKESLFNVLDNIRKKIENHNFKDIDKLTCSIGASLYTNNEEIEKTIKRADLLLYRAKEEGRNRVLV